MYTIEHTCTRVFVLQYPVFRYMNRNLYVQGDKYTFLLTAFEMTTLSVAV